MANEKRLIDLDRLIRSLKAMASEYDAVSLHGIINSLKEWPTVDATEVVRRNDCKYRYTAKSGLILCTQHITMTPKDDDFCSYGERREGE